jgi:hypothetical protein
LIVALVLTERVIGVERVWGFVGLLGLRSYFLHSSLMIYTALASLVATLVGVGVWVSLIRREGRLSARDVVLLVYVLAAGASALPVIMSLGVLGLGFR